MAKPAAAYQVRGPLTELTLARIRELTREPEALFWVFVFPIVLTAILGVAFRSRPPEALPVAVVAGPLADAQLAALSKETALKPSILSEEEARHSLRTGDFPRRPDGLRVQSLGAHFVARTSRTSGAGHHRTRAQHQS